MVRKYSYYLASIWELLSGFTPWQQVLLAFMRPGAPQDLILQIRPSGLRFKVRGAMDIWTIKETFLDRFYEKLSPAIQDGWTIIDIGAGIGDFSILSAFQRPRARVIAFEPTPESCALCQENLRLNAIANVQVFQQAIWSTSGEVAIDTGHVEPGQFTTHDQNGNANHEKAGILATGLSLEDAFERLDVERCDLLKMDCEGAEFEILFKAPDHILERIGHIVMEYHDRATTYRHTDLAKFLTGKGFKVRVMPNFVHADLGYLAAQK